MASVKLLQLTDRDSEGKAYGYGYLNRDHIIYAAYNAVENKMMVVVNDMQSQTGVVHVDALNKEGKVTGSKREGVATQGTNKSFVYDDPGNIVLIHNFMCNSNYTVEDFPGFQMHVEIVEEIRKAKDRKMKEEEDKKWNTDLEAENRYLTSVNKPTITLEELKQKRAELDVQPHDSSSLKSIIGGQTKESRVIPESGQTETTPGGAIHSTEKASSEGATGQGFGNPSQESSIIQGPFEKEIF